jgi:tRNA pseudouridine55 synthase
VIIDGLLLVDKPPCVTSHHVVCEIRKIVRTKKVGHYGTLDPMATGLLVVAVGKATRLFPFFSKTDKVYQGQIRLGYSTDTYDSEGEPASQEREDFPSKQRLVKEMKKFQGEIDQIPPPFSAKKYKGKPLYVLARRKEQFELSSRKVFVHYFDLTSYDPPFVHFAVKCSSGTYIRSLAHNLGQALGCGAHLSHLTRIKVGDFGLDQAYSLEDIKRLIKRGKTEGVLFPLETLLPQFPKVVLNESGTALVRNGNIVFPEDILSIFPQDNSLLVPTQEHIFRLFNKEGKLLAFGKKDIQRGSIQPFLVIGS